MPLRPSTLSSRPPRQADFCRRLDPVTAAGRPPPSTAGAGTGDNDPLPIPPARRSTSFTTKVVQYLTRRRWHGRRHWRRRSRPQRGCSSVRGRRRRTEVEGSSGGGAHRRGRGLGGGVRRGSAGWKGRCRSRSREATDLALGHLTIRRWLAVASRLFHPTAKSAHGTNKRPLLPPPSPTTIPPLATTPSLAADAPLLPRPWTPLSPTRRRSPLLHPRTPPLSSNRFRRRVALPNPTDVDAIGHEAVEATGVVGVTIIISVGGEIEGVGVGEGSRRRRPSGQQGSVVGLDDLGHHYNQTAHIKF